jgi:hypothetical protein
MASTRERNGRYTGLYRDSVGKQKSAGTFDTDKEALKAAEYAEAVANPPKPQARSGQLQDTRAGTPVPGQNPADRTADSYLMTDSPVPADDADDYEDDPEEDNQGTAFLDLAVTTLAGAVTGIVGYTAGGPGGAVVSNTATPFLAAVFRKVVRPFWDDQSRKADMMLETAAETGGLTREELADRAAASEESRFLTYKAVQAATDTLWPAGVRAIGRAYLAGLLAKDKPVLDIRLRVLGIMQDLDEMHVRLLDLLVKYEPDVEQQKLVAVPHWIPSYVNRFGGGDRPDNPKVWSVGRRKWTAGQVIAVVPDLGQVLPSLLGELRESGLAQENDTAPDTAKRLADDLAKQVNRQAGQMDQGRRMKPITLQQPTPMRASEPSWSPTELGEKILAFYAEAAAEDSQDPGGSPGGATS